jgi:hypothetical protein
MIYWIFSDEIGTASSPFKNACVERISENFYGETMAIESAINGEEIVAILINVQETSRRYFVINWAAEYAPKTLGFYFQNIEKAGDMSERLVRSGFAAIALVRTRNFSRVTGDSPYRTNISNF